MRAGRVLLALSLASAAFPALAAPLRASLRDTHSAPELARRYGGDTTPAPLYTNTYPNWGDAPLLPPAPQPTVVVKIPASPSAGLSAGKVAGIATGAGVAGGAAVAGASLARSALSKPAAVPSIAVAAPGAPPSGPTGITKTDVQTRFWRAEGGSQLPAYWAWVGGEAAKGHFVFDGYDLTPTGLDSLMEFVRARGITLAPLAAAATAVA